MNWSNLLSNRRSGGKNVVHDPGRSAFEQDFDRIVFSYPFRRLQDKTQVHPLPEHDFVHNRLTHSLEVSSVGRSLGKRVGQQILSANPVLGKTYSSHDFGAIVAAASLAHDIGNPPFGHSGEGAISEFFKYGAGIRYATGVSAEEWGDLINFEGNAQGFRILNRSGVKLTYATLAAFSKYPRQSIIEQQDTARRSQKKYGFFQGEKEVFKAIADQVALRPLASFSWVRHPLAFLVEAADDICYHLIDLEDGCRLGLVSAKETIRLLSTLIGDKFNKDKLDKIATLNEKIGVLRAMAVGQLIVECSNLFMAKESAIMQGDFDTALTDAIPSTPILLEIIQLSRENIYQSRSVVETEAAGFEVLPGLLQIFTEAAVNRFENNALTKKNKTISRLLPEEVTLGIEREYTSLYDVLMGCVDFVSGLTDRHAISMYRKIKGISLPNG